MTNTTMRGTPSNPGSTGSTPPPRAHVRLRMTPDGLELELRRLHLLRGHPVLPVLARMEDLRFVRMAGLVLDLDRPAARLVWRRLLEVSSTPTTGDPAPSCDQPAARRGDEPVPSGRP